MLTKRVQVTRVMQGMAQMPGGPNYFSRRC
jgi:hypothetical protein